MVEIQFRNIFFTNVENAPPTAKSTKLCHTQLVDLKGLRLNTILIGIMIRLTITRVEHISVIINYYYY